jgi:4-amino-4-deoxy-L-arabinose transferase-like glycosyltransferase
LLVEFWNDIGYFYLGVSVLFIWLLIFVGVFLFPRWKNKEDHLSCVKVYMVCTVFPMIPLLIILTLVAPLIVGCLVGGVMVLYNLYTLAEKKKFD